MSRKTLVVAAAVAGIIALTGAVPAFAFDEVQDPPRDCYECHGLVGEETTQTVDPAGREEPHLRKGPHGGYTNTTSKCSACHTVHAAPAGGFALLPAATIRSTCEHCHDGTGGQGVYGVIKARTGFDPSTDPGGSAHRIEIEGNNVIPGGSEDGTARSVTFSGADGTLTCSDCHSPHDGNTVEPFLGDRWRSDDEEADALAGTRTNRLLRTQPVGGLLETEEYGTDWCLSCHRGHDESAHVVNHPVARDADGYYYDNVARFAEPGVLEDGPLGRSNAGYVMPEEEGRPAPICQQCHENSRRAGQVPGYELQLHESEEFTITEPDGLPDGDPWDGGSMDNPRFQTFPHESLREYFLAIEDYDPDGNAVGQDALCMRCHDMDPGS